MRTPTEGGSPLRSLTVGGSTSTVAAMEPLDTVGVHVFAQPAMALTVAVYTVVAQGEAFTHAPVVLESAFPPVSR
ncbi:MAG: hypothetical protein IPN38_04070 [Flavobacteriales bacterium]|nr:hypothetical protein [Flavobacteriales bacterium]